MKLAKLRRKVEFGDAVLFPYILALAFQYFWLVESDVIAWTLAFAAAAALWLLHLQTKPELDERTPRSFWLIVGLPLFLIFLIRAPIPDLAFDVLNHRLIQAERSLHGPQLLPGDFFPTVFPFNPLPDMLTGMFRHLLGYRLGTIINLLAVVWACTLLEKILRPVISNSILRSLGVLLAVFTEHVLFQVNSYMVDLLALPLLLEATRVALNFIESSAKRRDLLFSALMLGGAMALKLTSAPMIIPILLVFAYQILRGRLLKQTGITILLAAFIFFVPLLPHMLYIFLETGNPVFPLYNNLIKSPLWPNMTLYDGRWGPRSRVETLLWPLLTVRESGRLSELGVYSGRLALGIVAAVFCLLLPKLHRHARLLAAVVILGALLWAGTSGYVRYALFVELLAGVLLIYLTTYLAKLVSLRWLRFALAAVPLLLLCAQITMAISYVRVTEWSKRPTLFDDPAAFRLESRWIWRDRDLMTFQTAEGRQMFARVDAWIVSSVKSNGAEVLLRPNVPMLAVHNFEYFAKPESRRRFSRALEALRGKRIYSLALVDETETALNFLKRRRLQIGEVKRVSVPFFSNRTTFAMSLIEIGLPEKWEIPRRTPDAPAITEATGPLDDDAFVANITSSVPETLKPGEVVDLVVKVKNASEFVWPARGRKDYVFLITISNAWLDEDGKLVDNTDGKSGLPHDLFPGEEVDVSLKVTAPSEPGEYIMEIDLIQEAITWFKDKGSTTWRARVKVQ